MAFHTAEYDVFAFLADPAATPPWHWESWRRIASAVDPLVGLTRGKPAVRSTQLGSNRSVVRFGRIRWNNDGHQKWTHASPANKVESMSWSFHGMEAWAPSWTQCTKEDAPPDLFLSISGRSTAPAQTFSHAFVLAVRSEIFANHKALVVSTVNELQKLTSSKLTAHQHRPWGRAWGNGIGYADAINDLHVVGLFKPGPAQTKPVSLDLFAEKWELFDGR